MSTTIIQDNHETVRMSLQITPDDAAEPLGDADEIHWYLTTDRRLGAGSVVLEKDISDITVLDGETLEFELSPEETRGIDRGNYWAEITLIWGNEPSTTALSPAIRVEESSYDSTA